MVFQIFPECREFAQYCLLNQCFSCQHHICLDKSWIDIFETREIFLAYLIALFGLIWDALCKLVPFLQFKNVKKNPWRSVTFKSNTPPWVFFMFLNCKNCMQLHKASHNNSNKVIKWFFVSSLTHVWIQIYERLSCANTLIYYIYSYNNLYIKLQLIYNSHF